MQLAWLYMLLGLFSRLRWSYEITRSVRTRSISVIVHLAFEILSLVGSNHLQGFWKPEITPIIATMEKMIKIYLFFFPGRGQPCKARGRSGRFCLIGLLSDMCCSVSVVCNPSSSPPSPFSVHSPRLSPLTKEEEALKADSYVSRSQSRRFEDSAPAN